jgi:transcriptional regulator with XRE-family HTH domain
MKNKKLEERRKRIPGDVKIFMEKSFAIVEQIDMILRKQKKTQKDLADLLHKRESEISKWMRGTHNFTQRTISKIEHVLGETITLCPKDIHVPDQVIFGDIQNNFITQNLGNSRAKSQQNQMTVVISSENETSLDCIFEN